MNIYTTKFKAICPNNGLIISYTLRIETREKIMVETIISACHLKTSGFHEDIADAIYARLGTGRQTLTAFHHGVHIETRRGFD